MIHLTNTNGPSDSNSNAPSDSNTNDPSNSNTNASSDSNTNAPSNSNSNDPFDSNTHDPSDNANAPSDSNTIASSDSNTNALNIAGGDNLDDECESDSDSPKNSGVEDQRDAIGKKENTQHVDAKGMEKHEVITLVPLPLFKDFLVMYAAPPGTNCCDVLFVICVCSQEMFCDWLF